MRKEQYIEKLNQYFHLIYDSRELGTFDNTHVRTCFQIWERRSYPRKTRRVLNTSNANKHYKFVRVGTKIGLYHIEDEVKHHKIVKLPQVKISMLLIVEYESFQKQQQVLLIAFQ
jgi:hypothetical protein